MKNNNTLFYNKKQEINFDFSAENITSDGAVLFSKLVEKKFNIINKFASVLTDQRNQGYTKHSFQKLLEQRIFLMIQGYQDCNDSDYLKNDPVICEAIGGNLASQPTMSRFENSFSITDIYRISEFMVERYAKSINKNRKQIVIDVDGTDDPTHGAQQGTLFNGYYEQYMYHPIVFHDGETGQLILSVLRPGSCHSNHWFVSILKRIVRIIRSQHPNIDIIIRGDCGFSCAEFYKLAHIMGLLFCLGITSNAILKKHTELLVARIKAEYVPKNEKYQEFTEAFEYQSETWDEPQTCFAKVESTGKGMNVRYICTNMQIDTTKSQYLDFYVKRGEASENRIKELKNMCFADRLSCHSFSANSFRLLLSSLCYEFFWQIKQLIGRSSNAEAKKWQIDNIRLYLMKVGGYIKRTFKRIKLCLSKSYICQDLFEELVYMCHTE